MYTYDYGDIKLPSMLFLIGKEWFKTSNFLNGCINETFYLSKLRLALGMLQRLVNRAKIVKSNEKGHT
ncbi:12055_t:CDS:1, partial [Acaulospora morrowiae]